MRHRRGRHRKRGRWHWALLGTYRLGAQLGLGQLWSQCPFVQQSLSVMQVGGWGEDNEVHPNSGHEDGAGHNLSQDGWEPDSCSALACLRSCASHPPAAPVSNRLTAMLGSSPGCFEHQMRMAIC